MSTTPGETSEFPMVVCETEAAITRRYADGTETVSHKAPVDLKAERGRQKQLFAAEERDLEAAMAEIDGACLMFMPVEMREAARARIRAALRELVAATKRNGHVRA